MKLSNFFKGKKYPIEGNEEPLLTSESKTFNRNLFMKFLFLTAFAFIIFGFTSSTAIKFSFKGKVSYILDADVIVLTDEKDMDVLIRLQGIDCPDSGQAYFVNAKEMVESYLKNQKVTVNCDSSDLYGRTFGEIILADGRNLNRELLRFGYAWHYKKYSKDAALAELEQSARNAKLGIWKYNDPVPPWVFRRDDTVKVNQFYGTFLEMPTDLPKDSKTTMVGSAKDIGASNNANTTNTNKTKSEGPLGVGNPVPVKRPRVYLTMEKQSGPAIDSQSDTRMVFICNARNSHCYHRIRYCTGAGDCNDKLESVSHSDAVNRYHRNGCVKCW